MALGLLLKFGHPATRRWGPHPKLESRPNPPLNGFSNGLLANPEIYEFPEAEGMGYAIRLPANRVLQDKIGHLLKRPVGRPPIISL